MICFGKKYNYFDNNNKKERGKDCINLKKGSCKDGHWKRFAIVIMQRQQHRNGQKHPHLEHTFLLKSISLILIKKYIYILIKYYNLI